MNFKMSSLNAIKGWSESDVLVFLEQNNLNDYKTFATAKGIDGYKLLSLSEGIIALWRPKLDPKKLMCIIDDLRNNPRRYFQQNKLMVNQFEAMSLEEKIKTDDLKKSIEPTHRKVKPKVPERKDSLREYNKVRNKIIQEDRNNKINENENTVLKNVDFQKMVAPQSFLYSKALKKVATKVNPYAPMDNSIIEQSQNDSIEVNKLKEIIEDVSLTTKISDRGYYEMNLTNKSPGGNHDGENVKSDKSKSKIKNKNEEDIFCLTETNDKRYYEMNVQTSEANQEKEIDSKIKNQFKINVEDKNYMTITNDRRYYEMSLPAQISEEKSNKINTPESKIENCVDDSNYMTITNEKDFLGLKSTSKNLRSGENLEVNDSENENLYEELVIFPDKGDDIITRGHNKKKVGILNRVLRKPISKKDKKEEITIADQQEIIGEKTSDINTRLQMINERVTKRLYPSQTNNYKVTPTTTFNIEINKDKYEKIPEFKLSKEFLEMGYNYFPYIMEVHDSKNIKHEENASNPKYPVNENIKTMPTFFVENDVEFYEEPPNTVSDDSFFNMDVKRLSENFYESADHVNKEHFNMENNHVYDEPTIDVEDYLEPRKIIKEGNIMDSLAEEILNLFDASAESRSMNKDVTSATSDKGSSICSETTDMASKKEENETKATEIIQKPPTPKKPLYLPKPLPRKKLPSYPDVTTKKNLARSGDDSLKPMLSFSANNMHTISPKPRTLTSMNSSQSIGQFDDVASRPFETLQKWNETLRNSLKKKRDVKRNMAERPLPVPVENEFYYMDVSRKDAENLLEGHADGTFILRPSSQSLHAYTVTLIYQERIYNFGCRRRQDGRLALGFTKATEQSFLTINELIEHYYHEKLVILVDGVKVGSTVLKKLNA